MKSREDSVTASADDELKRKADALLAPLIARCAAITREWEDKRWEPDTADARELAPVESAGDAAAKQDEAAARRVWRSFMERTDALAARLLVMKARPTSSDDLLRVASAFAAAVDDEFEAMHALTERRFARDDASKRLRLAVGEAYEARRGRTNVLMHKVYEQRVDLMKLFPLETAILGRKEKR